MAKDTRLHREISANKNRFRTKTVKTKKRPSGTLKGFIFDKQENTKFVSLPFIVHGKK